MSTPDRNECDGENKKGQEAESHHMWEGEKGVTLIGWSKMTTLRTDPNAEKVSVQKHAGWQKLQGRVISAKALRQGKTWVLGTGKAVILPGPHKQGDNISGGAGKRGRPQ